jgi:mannose-6-phosphate isomerase class I
LETILLFKYLDAREDLSIQVHPNDALEKKDTILLENRNVVYHAS